MKTTKSTKTIAAVACACLMVAVAQAIPITGNDANLLNAIGYMKPGVDASSADATIVVNDLLTLANGGSASAVGYLFTVINYGSYSTPAVLVDNGAVGGGNSPNGNWVDLGTGGYAYIEVKYDGTGGSGLVWDISGVSGLISIANPDVTGNVPDKYLLFTAPTNRVPDGGTTIALLGFALVGVDFLRRKLS